MIKPQVQDGVPEEEGYYLIKGDLYRASDKWVLTEVRERNGSLEAVKPRNTQSIDCFEIRFNEFTWSEKIEPPTQ